jgi:hypothetical protein
MENYGGVWGQNILFIIPLKFQPLPLKLGSSLNAACTLDIIENYCCCLDMDKLRIVIQAARVTSVAQ